jgi:hypothetical protein
MRRLWLAYIAALLPTMAMGQEALPSVEQRADGNQTASNVINITALRALTDDYMSTMLQFGSTGNLAQYGSNTVNSIVYAGALGNVVQRFHGIQSVENRTALGVVDIYGGISQHGTNVAGSTISETLNFADQLFGADARQQILNSAEIAILYGTVTQYGSNTANYAEAALAIGTASQTIELGAEQRVDNRLHLAAMSAVTSSIAQSGENFGNIMISETVETVTRNFAGDQIVHNVVQLGDDNPGTISQHGSNVANLIMSSRIGMLSQTSIGRQEVINEVFNAQGQLVTGGNIVQTADNYVNLTVLTMPAEGGDNAAIGVEQNADFPQNSSGNGAGSQTGNAVSIDR